mmetsp:Transcript_155581/g.290348  ORF Transcript_155581/g.290348 Transcript_155581/m.290348 type:complete len:426 (+) Transcript_155581:53-1330(+)
MDCQAPLTNHKDLEGGKSDLEAGKSYGSFPHENPDFHKSFASESATVEDSMTYSLPWLRTWAPLFLISGTVWHSMTFWKMMGQLLLLATLVALAAYNLLPDPEYLDTTKFGNIVSVLTLFVSLMLSFFLSASVSRWLGSVDGFEQLFQSIRMLALQFHALGTNRERADACLRYAMMSAHFLVYELGMMKLQDQDRASVTSDMWDKYLAKPGNTRKYSTLYPEEKQILDNCDMDNTACMWLWISTLIGRCAADGQIPPMASPTYGRIMNLANSAQTGLRAVKTAVVVQMPFVYVHLLSVLVHVTCILQAINLGLSMGVSWHAIRKYWKHYYGPGSDGLPDSQIVPLTAHVQTICVDGFKGILGPLLYQAFFDIGVTISSPFSYPGAGVPVERMIDNLEKELDCYNQLAEKPPFWDPPSFQTKPPVE